MLQKLVLAVPISLLAIGSLYADVENRLIPTAVQRQLALPEDEIDVGIAALTFAKEVYPDLDIAAYSRKLDDLARKVALLARGTLDPELRIRVLNTALFRHEGFHYDRDPFSRSVKAYYYLNGILDTKKGICYTLPLLYVAVAQRLRYPIYPVAAPDHMFVRYVHPSFSQPNIETTSGGKYFTDSHYIEDFSVPERALKSGSYLKTMTYREFLGHIMVNSTFATRKNGPKVFAYLKKGSELDPTFADFHFWLGEGYVVKSKISKGHVVESLLAKSRYHAAKAKELGYVSQSEIAAGRRTRGRSE